jgi:hypothetical protein
MITTFTIMSAFLGAAFAALVVYVTQLARHAVEQEVKTRVSRLPLGLAKLATARMPEPARSELRAEIAAELYAIADESAGLPITSWVRRFWRSFAFSADLIRARDALTRATPTPVSAASDHNQLAVTDPWVRAYFEKQYEIVVSRMDVKHHLNYDRKFSSEQIADIEAYLRWLRDSERDAKE